MRRAYWTLDLLDAHIVAQMLRHEGIDAWVFDDNIVRQNWLQAIAYGGYRVMTRTDDLAAAQKLVGDYAAGERSLAADDPEPNRCPGCNACATQDDAAARRGLFLWFFLCFLGLPAIPIFALASYASSLNLIDAAGAAALSIAVFFLLAALLPPIYAARTLKWRYRCDNCGQRWQAPPERWSILRGRAIDAPTA